MEGSNPAYAYASLQFIQLRLQRLHAQLDRGFRNHALVTEDGMYSPGEGYEIMWKGVRERIQVLLNRLVVRVGFDSMNVNGAGESRLASADSRFRY